MVADRVDMIELACGECGRIGAACHDRIAVKRWENEDPEFHIAWERAEAAWEAKVEARMDTLENAALVLAMYKHLTKRRGDLARAESELCDAIEKTRHIRDDVLRIATVIEMAAKAMGRAA